jgi:hypothetical protein
MTREVTKDEFFNAIGPKNVHPTPEGKYPYTSVFYDPNRREHGRIVGELKDGTHTVVNRYYLPD